MDAYLLFFQAAALDIYFNFAFLCDKGSETTAKTASCFLLCAIFSWNEQFKADALLVIVFFPRNGIRGTFFC